MKIKDMDIHSIIEGGYREPYTLFYDDDDSVIVQNIPMFIEGYETNDEFDKGKGIVITIDELIEIIDRIEFRNISNEIYDIDEEEENDLKKLQNDFKDLGVIVSLNEIYETHLIYSDTLNVEWANEPTIEDEIYCLLKGICDARNY